MSIFTLLYILGICENAYAAGWLRATAYVIGMLVGVLPVLSPSLPLLAWCRL
jgi:hypothetical protein